MLDYGDARLGMWDVLLILGLRMTCLYKDNGYLLYIFYTTNRVNLCCQMPVEEKKVKKCIYFHFFCPQMRFAVLYYYRNYFSRLTYSWFTITMDCYPFYLNGWF